MRRTRLILLALTLFPAAAGAQGVQTPVVADTTIAPPSVDSLAARTVAAAPEDELPQGTRVRLSSPTVRDAWIQGRLMEADSEGITVLLGPAGRTMRMPRSSIARFEAEVGTLPGRTRTARGARRGARFGLAVVGALFVALAASDDGSEDSPVFLAALIGAPIAVGATLVGMLAEPGTKWRSVPVPMRVGPPQEVHADEDLPVHGVRRHPAGPPGLRAGPTPFGRWP